MINAFTKPSILREFEIRIYIGSLLFILYNVSLLILSPWEANKRSVSLVGSIWLTLLYYIRIWILSAEIIFLFWWWEVGGGWGPTFWFFKSLDNNMVYS